MDSVYQDLGGDHNSVPEDCKCAGEHSEHLLDVHGSVPDNRYAQKSSISRSHFGEGGPSVHLPPPLQNEISGLETSEHTDGRVHFPGLTEGVSDVPGFMWRPL